MLGLRRLWPSKFSSSKYWEQRYRRGGNSGAGSYDLLSEFKAGFINDFAIDNDVQAVVEFGCGDGNQLNLFELNSYLGLDVSKTAIKNCQASFKDDASRSFHWYDPDGFEAESEFDLAMSLDVLYHLVEDEVYFQYLDHLTSSSSRWIIIYSCDHNSDKHPPHVRPRNFTKDFSERYPSWNLVEKLDNPFPLEKFGPKRGSWSDFYVFEKV